MPIVYSERHLILLSAAETLPDGSAIIIGGDQWGGFVNDPGPSPGNVHHLVLSDLTVT